MTNREDLAELTSSPDPSRYPAPSFDDRMNDILEDIKVAMAGFTIGSDNDARKKKMLTSVSNASKAISKRSSKSLDKAVTLLTEALRALPNWERFAMEGDEPGSGDLGACQSINRAITALELLRELARDSESDRPKSTRTAIKNTTRKIRDRVTSSWTGSSMGDDSGTPTGQQSGTRSG